MTKPTEPGFYWARPRKFRWWPLLIEVTGESPFLKMEVRMNQTSDNNWGTLESIVEFSPKINMPVPDMSQG